MLRSHCPYAAGIVVLTDTRVNERGRTGDSGEQPPFLADSLLTMQRSPFALEPLALLVPGPGFEPGWPFGQRILSPLRLPFRHPGGRTSTRCCSGGCDFEISALNRAQ